MAQTGIQWGAVAGHLRIGVNVRWDDIGPATTQSHVYADFYYQTQAWGYDDDQTLNFSGSLGGSWNYHCSSAFGATVTTLIGTYDIGVQGTSYSGGPSWTFAAAVSGSVDGNPSVSVGFTLPARPASPPDAPSTPSAYAITSSSMTWTWSIPATHGAGITSYRLQVATDAGFAGLVFNADVGGTTNVTGLSPNTTYYARVYANSAAGNSGWSGTGVAATLPVVPPAPSGATLTRNSDTSFTTTWTNNPSTGGPYANVVVQRSADGGAWATVATLAGTTASFTDTTTSANHSYAYRVYATNSAGSSGFSTTATLVTTPAAPSSVTAVRGTGATVNLTWVNNSVPAYQTEVYEADGVGGWTLQTTLAAGTTAWTDASPAAGSTQYRLRAKTTGTPLLYSADVLSPTVVVLSPPNAPTSLTAGPVVDATEPIVFGWVHNSVDGSAQTQYQIRYRVEGAGTWTTLAPVVSVVPEFTMTAGTLTNIQTYEWEVRTWGAATTGGTDGTGDSPWSSTAVFNARARPTASISTPVDGGVVNISTVTVVWEYYDAQGTAETAWTARLYDASGSVIEIRTGVYPDTAVAFAAQVDDGSAYSVSVDVRNAWGLWSTGPGSGLTAFTVAYDPPPAPVIEPTWNPDSATVDVWVQNQSVIIHGWTGTPDDSSSIEQADGVPDRTNLATSPKIPSVFYWDWVTGTSEAVTNTEVTGAVDGPVLPDAPAIVSYFRLTTTTAKTGGDSGPYYIQGDGVDRVAGDSLTSSIYVRASAAVTARLVIRQYEDINGYVGTETAGPGVTLAAGVWTRLSATDVAEVDSSGLRAWVQMGPTDILPVGATIDATAVLIEHGSSLGAYFDGDGPDSATGVVPTAYVDLYRAIDGGSFELIATDAPTNTTLTDYSPTVAGTNTYRAVAVSATPSTAASLDVDVVTPQPGEIGGVWLSGGPGLSVACKAVSNPDQQIAPGPAEVVLHRFAGRDDPVLFESPDDSLALSLEADILKVHVDAGECSSLAQWEALTTTRGVKLWRDPSGRRVPVAATIRLSRPPGGQVAHVSVTATRIDRG